MVTQRRKPNKHAAGKGRDVISPQRPRAFWWGCFQCWGALVETLVWREGNGLRVCCSLQLYAQQTTQFQSFLLENENTCDYIMQTYLACNTEPFQFEIPPLFASLNNNHCPTWWRPSIRKANSSCASCCSYPINWGASL